MSMKCRCMMLGFGVQLSTQRVTGPMFFHWTSSEHYVRLIIVSGSVVWWRKIVLVFYARWWSGSVSNFVAALNELFGKWHIRLQSSSLNLVTSLWGTLKEKTYLKNPHSSEELQENIRHEISAVPLQEHQCMSEKYSHILRYT
jgi:hypothetical protein